MRFYAKLSVGRSRTGILMSSCLMTWLLAATVPSAFGCELAIDSEEARALGDKIWRNETGGDPTKILWWNRGEDFASLGLGHFIWYPRGRRGPFEESFRRLLEFLAARNVDLPDWLADDPPPHCPWPSREAFISERDSERALALARLLDDTRDLQIEFLVRRLATSREPMLSATPAQRANIIEARFCSLASTPAGRYALIDYVNFKGEGVDPAERYADEGWGLLQVLDEMRGGVPPHADFADAASRILKRRVENAPPERVEQRWLDGWLNRVATYAR